MSENAVALETVDRILDRGGDADDILRSVLAALHEHGTPFACLRFVEQGRLVDGPSVGELTGATVTAPVLYEGRPVGELELATDDTVLAEQVAARISTYVLVGWDTSGEPWAP